MAKLKDVTRKAILLAMIEYNEMGREAFLSKYGYKRANRFYIVKGRRRFDSKAIIGVAAGLRCNEFSGGAATIGPVCKRTGFKLVDVTE